MGARRAVWLFGLGLAALASAGTAGVAGRAEAQERASDSRPTDVAPTDLSSMDLAARRRSAMPSVDDDASLIDLRSRREGWVADKPVAGPDVKGFADAMGSTGMERGTSVFGRSAATPAETSPAVPAPAQLAADPARIGRGTRRPCGRAVIQGIPVAPESDTGYQYVARSF